MDRLNVFFDQLFNLHDAFLIFAGIVSERLHNKWRNRDKNPYKWDCVDCREKNGMFRCSANSIEAIDAMILNHKEASHGRPF